MSIWRNITQKLTQVPKAEAKSVARNRLFLASALAASCFVLISGKVIALSTDVKPKTFYGKDDGNIVERGRILDRNGRVLATSLPAFMLYVDPAEVMNPYEATAKVGRYSAAFERRGNL